MRLKEFSVELQDRIVTRHRSGEGYQNISAALKVPKNTVASILKWKTFGTTNALARAGLPAKLSNQGRRALVRNHTYCEAWWGQHHAVGMFVSGTDWETSQY